MLAFGITGNRCLNTELSRPDVVLLLFLFFFYYSQIAKCGYDLLVEMNTYLQLVQSLFGDFQRQEP